MRERPIPFSAPMVRAILAGTKTQTRWLVTSRHPTDHGCISIPCPYGEPGDRLWSRESRWASRIVLEVTDVRVERLQAITEEDARAEGLRRHACGWTDGAHLYDTLTARSAFAELWDSIERASWASDPWVWVVSFRRLEVRDA